MSSVPEGARQRLFFALWPPDELRLALGTLARAQVPPGARAVAAGNLHITLAFVGAVTGETRACLERAAATVTGAPFELALDRLGAWPGPGILWLAPSAIPPALGLLAGDLQQALQPCGYRPEARAYQPHVTLARKLKGRFPAVAVPPLHWPVRDFVLVESLTTPAGPGYQVLRRWPLGG